MALKDPLLCPGPLSRITGAQGPPLGPCSREVLSGPERLLSKVQLPVMEFSLGLWRAFPVAGPVLVGTERTQSCSSGPEGQRGRSAKMAGRGSGGSGQAEPEWWAGRPCSQRGGGGDPTEHAGVQVGGPAFGGLQNSWNVSAGPLPGI